MFCKNCGKEIDDNAYVCPNCGVKVQEKPVEEDSGSKVGWGILSFLIPLVGLILFCIWKNERPKTAKVCGICALVSVILAVIYYIVVVIFIGTMIATLY